MERTGGKDLPLCRLALLPSRTAFRRDAHRPGEYMDTKKTSKDYDKLSQIFQKQHKMAELLGIISADFYVSC